MNALCSLASVYGEVEILFYLWERTRQGVFLYFGPYAKTKVLLVDLSVAEM